MSGELGGRIPVDAVDVLGQQQARLEMQERRPKVRKAADIMGPTLGPSAVIVEDLNSDMAAFNGMYLVSPGATGSPDPSKWWAGQTIADPVTGGTQFLATFMPADSPHQEARRGFSISADGAVRQFSEWTEGGGGGAGGGYMEVSVGSQNIGNDSWTWLGFGGNTSGDGWEYVGGGQSERYFVCTEAGVYSFNFSWLWSGTNSGIRQGRPYIGGTSQPEYMAMVPGHAAGFGQICSLTRRFSVGQTVRLRVRQTSGGTLAIPEAFCTIVKQGV